MVLRIRHPHLRRFTFVLLVGGACASACRAPPEIHREEADIALTPAGLDFGEVLVGTHATRGVELSNPGSDELRICLPNLATEACATASRLEPESSSPFQWPRPDMTWSLGTSDVATFTVRFQPQEPGIFEGRIVLGHNGRNGPATAIPIRGSAKLPPVRLSDQLLNFGEVPDGERATLALSLQNDSTIDLPLSLSPITEGSFELTAAPAVLPAGATTSLTITFAPERAAVFSDVIALSYCPSCSVDVRLVGTGTRPAVRVEPSRLDFGSVPQGLSEPLTFVVSNPGASTLQLRGIERGADTSSEFVATVASPLPLDIAAGGNVEVEVSYAGGAPGVDVGRFLLHTNAWDDPATGALENAPSVAVVAEAVGPDIQLSEDAVDFGVVGPGTSRERVLLVENAGNAPLQIEAIRLSGSSEIGLSAPQTPLSLLPGDNRTLFLRFAPSVPGSVAAQLVLDSNDPDSATRVVTIQGAAGTPSGCALVVDPPDLDFGLVEAGRGRTLAVSMGNVGDATCQLQDLTVTADPEIRLAAGEPSARTLEPGAVTHVSLAYTPTQTGVSSGLLEWSSDDPTLPVGLVVLSGQSDIVDLRALPGRLDFGAVPVGCGSGTRRATLYNTSGDGLTIESVELIGSGRGVLTARALQLPLELAPNQSVDLELSYVPNEARDERAMLTVHHSGAPAPVVLPVSARGVSTPDVEDRFTQGPADRADVLFVVDNSRSMRDRNAQLGASLRPMLSFAQAHGVDLQIGVTTADLRAAGEAGRLVAAAPYDTAIIDGQTPQPEGAFAVNVTTNGGGAERGLAAGFFALTAPLSLSDNAGFRRNDAALTVIYISDEDDQSNGEAEMFARHILDFSRFGLPAVAHAVVGPQSTGCDGSFGDADPGPRYLAVSEMTGGLSIPVCQDDWLAVVDALTGPSLGLRRHFGLSGRPALASVDVRIDGVTVDPVNGGGQQQWDYDEALGVLRLSPALTPPIGASVEVSYQLECL